MTTMEQTTYTALDALGVQIAVERAVAAERARCAAVCREVAALHGGVIGDGAEECAEAILHGGAVRRWVVEIRHDGRWQQVHAIGRPHDYPTREGALDLARYLYPDTEHLSEMCRVVERGAVAR